MTLIDLKKGFWTRGAAAFTARRWYFRIQNGDGKRVCGPTGSAEIWGPTGKVLNLLRGGSEAQIPKTSHTKTWGQKVKETLQNRDDPLVRSTTQRQLWSRFWELQFFGPSLRGTIRPTRPSTDLHPPISPPTMQTSSHTGRTGERRRRRGRGQSRAHTPALSLSLSFSLVGCPPSHIHTLFLSPFKVGPRPRSDVSGSEEDPWGFWVLASSPVGPQG